MADLQTLISAVDELSQGELDKLYVHAEAAQMSEDEIYQAIDQTIAEVRRERKTNGRERRLA
jgi:hypothetical protein